MRSSDSLHGAGFLYAFSLFSPQTHVIIIILINLFIYFYLWLHWVFVAVRGLFSSCGKRGLLFVAVHRFLI